MFVRYLDFMPKEWLETLLMIVESQYRGSTILRRSAFSSRMHSNQKITQAPAQYSGESAGTSYSAFISTRDCLTDFQNCKLRPLRSSRWLRRFNTHGLTVPYPGKSTEHIRVLGRDR